MRPAAALLPPLALCALIAAVAYAASPRHAHASPRRPPIRFAFRLPVSFEPNQGQAASGVRFLTRGRGYTLQITDSGAELSIASGDALRRRRERKRDAEAGRNVPVQASRAPALIRPDLDSAPASTATR